MWFGAIYVLLMVSLVGCIIPRTIVYARNIRSEPPAAPRNLLRLPDHASYDTSESPEAVAERARAVLTQRGYRLRAPREGEEGISAERGYLREVGNLVFHLSVLIVLAGFATGGLLGYKGGVILVQGTTFSNNLTSYDDFVPGSLFQADRMEPFSFTVDDFDIDWLTSGPRQGMARGFQAHLRYRESPDDAEQDYDLKVNHPLKIGSTEVFLIGHGYAPVITIRDGDGNVVYSRPTVFLPTDASFLSLGVVKAPDAQPQGIGLEGLLYPTYVKLGGDPVNVMGDDKNPLLSMLVYTGDLNMDDPAGQSVYLLDKSKATKVLKPDGSDFRIDLSLGETVELPDGLGSVTFDSITPWTRLQVSQTPGKLVALAGVSLALLGLLGSLFIRPRRVWVRTRRQGAGTLVEVAALDRSGGGDVAPVLEEIVTALQAGTDRRTPDEETS
ncbi:unannotated protein [freshwater metagenome]|uniref:Unannotated protein n=1 Tax=freshwater metagenome TaxID=449393 RepID=A0A6J6QY88_9ZZZZ